MLCFQRWILSLRDADLSPIDIFMDSSSHLNENFFVFLDCQGSQDISLIMDVYRLAVKVNMTFFGSVLD